MLPKLLAAFGVGAPSVKAPTWPMYTFWLGTSPAASKATVPVTPSYGGVAEPTAASSRRTASRSDPARAMTSRSR